MQFDPRPVLAAEFPDLAIRTVEELGEGWDHIAYLVNDDLVFRIPWAIVEGPETTEPEPDASVEIGLLRHLAGQLSVQIPEPVLVAPDSRYFGYRYLAGRSIDTLVGGPASPGTDFVRTAVRVALEVHHLVPIGHAEALGLRRLDDVGADHATAVAALTGGRLTGAAVATGRHAVGIFRERWRAAAERRLVTMHADLGLDHWLVNDEGEIAALIDWTDTCVAPPENDLSPFMWHQHLVGDAIVAYEEATGWRLDRQLIFANGFVNILGDVGELVAEGDPDDDAYIDQCVDYLRTWSDPDLMATLDVALES